MILRLGQNATWCKISDYCGRIVYSLTFLVHLACSKRVVGWSDRAPNLRSRYPLFCYQTISHTSLENCTYIESTQVKYLAMCLCWFEPNGFFIVGLKPYSQTDCYQRSYSICHVSFDKKFDNYHPIIHANSLAI